MRAKRKRDALDYFTFDAVAWLSSPDVTRMSAAQRGAYIHLLAIESRDRECSLPDDDAALADISKLGDEWSTAGALVREQFIAHPTIESRLINSRLFREWKTAWSNYRKACKRNKQNRLSANKKNDDSSTTGQQLVTQGEGEGKGKFIVHKQHAPLGAKPNGTTTAHVESGVRATVDNRPKGDLEAARKWVRECGGADAARAKVTAYSKANAIPENIALADIAPPYAYIALQEAERKPS